MEQQQVLLSVQDLRFEFTLRGQVLHALRGISLDVYRGESLAIVGESGSGKSVFVKCLMGLNDGNGYVAGGKILYHDQDLTTLHTADDWRAIRGHKIAMVLQDPMTSLNPLKTIGWQIQEAVELHQNLHGDAAKKEVYNILTEVGINEPERRYKQYPHEFSGGMRQRVVIAIAMACRPEILICDEPTTALDVTIQHQILKQMRSLQEEYGTSIIFITHDLGVVAELCDRVVVLYGGLVMEEAEINDLFENPLHPYTMGLLASIPGLTKDKSERLQSIPGSPPDMTKPPKGCPFASRCQFARNICAAECPPFVQVGSRQARCWLLQPDAPAEGNPLHEKLAEAERKAD